MVARLNWAVPESRTYVSASWIKGNGLVVIAQLDNQAKKFDIPFKENSTNFRKNLIPMVPKMSMKGLVIKSESEY